MELGVNLVALGSGLSMAYLGNSHFGLEDVAVIRSIPNINISCPADCLELLKVLQDYEKNERGPSYIRLTGIPGCTPTYDKDFDFKFGKYVSLKEGKDLIIVATGSVVSEAKKATELLKELDFSVALVNINTIKPLDETFLNKISKFPDVFVVEEHTYIGGLFSTICEHLSVVETRPRIHSIALPDKFGPTGTYKYLLDHHGLTGEKIAQKISHIIKK